MTTPTLPTPPAGTRWREVAHPTTSQVFWRYTDRLEVRKGSDGTWFPVRQFRDVDLSPQHIAVLHDLMQNPTEPLPAPVVDRSGEAWKVVSDGIYRAMTYDTRMWAGNANETDALLLALAPHWRELAALAGEKEPKVTVLEGWWNVYANEASRRPTQDAAAEFAYANASHVAVRLAVVEDAS